MAQLSSHGIAQPSSKSSENCYPSIRANLSPPYPGRTGPTVSREGRRTLTYEPGPDIADHHNRQVVALEPQDWRAWLYGTKGEATVLQPSSAEVFMAGLG
jgi:hypothetical protein